MKLFNAVMKNNNYRKVLETNKKTQIVAMCLKKHEDIPEEKHVGHEQLFIVLKGKMYIKINNKGKYLNVGDSITVKSGEKHYVKNSGNDDLKIITIYSPPEHYDNRIDKRQPKN